MGLTEWVAAAPGAGSWWPGTPWKGTSPEKLPVRHGPQLTAHNPQRSAHGPRPSTAHGSQPSTAHGPAQPMAHGPEPSTSLPGWE